MLSNAQYASALFVGALTRRYIAYEFSNIGPARVREGNSGGNVGKKI